MNRIKKKHIITIINKLDMAYKGQALKEKTIVLDNSFAFKKSFKEKGETSLLLYYTAPDDKKTKYASIENITINNGLPCVPYSYDLNAYKENFSKNWLWYLLYDIINEFKEKTGISPVISINELLDDLWDDSVEN